MSKPDYYQVLGVTKSSSQKEIKKAYLQLAKKYHPDQNRDDPSAEKKFKELSEAYEVLHDEQKKAAYDRFGHAAFENGGRNNSGFGAGGFGANSGFANGNINDIFGDFFSDFMGGGRSSTQRKRSAQIRGADLKYNLEISLEEAFRGLEKNIRFSAEIKCTSCDGYGTKDKSAITNCPQCAGNGRVRMQQGFFAVEQTCSKCNGQGSIVKNPCATCYGQGRKQSERNLVVNVPAGVENGTRIRITGEGEAGIKGGSAGDLYLFVSVKEHDIYYVEGADLHFKLPLSFTKAALGGEVEVPIIDGSKVKLTIPAGTENGDKLRLREKGMSKIRSSYRGDLYAHAHIYTPKNLKKRQKELLQELDREIGESQPAYQDKSFFSKMKDLWS